MVVSHPAGGRVAVGAQETAIAVVCHSMATESFGDRLRRYRRLRGLSQAELADKSATDKGQIGKMETTPSYEPTRDVVRRLAKALDIPPWMLEDEDFRPAGGIDWQASLMADERLDEETKQALAQVIRRVLGQQS